MKLKIGPWTRTERVTLQDYHTEVDLRRGAIHRGTP